MRETANVRTITATELLAPEPRTAQSDAGLLERLVQQEVAKALATKDGFLFEPSFRSKRVSDEIRRLQTIPERKVHALRFQLYGCLNCGTKKASHYAYAYCASCYHREQALRKKLRSQLEHAQEPPRFTDLTALAKKALHSVDALPAKRLPALKGEE